VKNRKGFLQTGFLTLIAVALTAPASSGKSSGPALDRKNSAGAEQGVFSILTYNVAGLPEPFSGSRPAKYSQLISPRLNDFDIVLTQEDFWYHRDLVSASKFPFVAKRSRAGTLGDGLSRFSQFPMSEVQHEAWRACSGKFRRGSDCMTEKGFAWAGHELAPGIWLDVYDLHMDAGRDPGDQEARAAEMDQLIAAIRRRSAGRALIVAGDWNLYCRRPRDRAVLQKLLDEEYLTDVCRALNCGEERVDRILFRSSAELELIPRNYRVEVERFKNEQGGQLSDHQAVSAVFAWKYLGAD
jgi:hypothetical protein